MASRELMEQGDARRRQVLSFIRAYIKRNGFPPSIQEIADDLDLTKTAAAHHLKRLEKDGKISVVVGKYRSLRVL